MRQKGFATLEVILMVMVIGILASVAVPRFNAVTAAANTAKIQADLSTLDSTAAIYFMREGKNPTTLSDVADYVRGASGELKPPSGKCYIKGTLSDVPSGDYSFTSDSTTGECQACLGTDKHTAADFYVEKSGKGDGEG